MEGADERDYKKSREERNSKGKLAGREEAEIQRGLLTLREGERGDQKGGGGKTLTREKKGSGSHYVGNSGLLG